MAIVVAIRYKGRIFQIMEPKEKLIEQIKNHLQFAATLAMFFPTLLYTFFKSVGELEPSSSKIFLDASSLLIVYLLSYVVFILIKNKINEKRLVWLDRFVLLSIFSFIIPTGFAVYAGATLPFLLGEILKLALTFQALTVLIVFAFIVFFGWFRKIKT